METVELKGKIRTEIKKGACRRLRNAGLIPVVCYGRNVAADERGVKAISGSVSPADLQKALSGEYGPNVVINLVLEGDGKEIRHNVMVQKLDRDPVTRRYLHCDFIVVEDDQKVLVEVPIRLDGKAVGVGLGGKLRQVARSVNVRCLPKDIPVDVPFDVTAMNLKDRAQVSQIVPADGLELVYANDFSIAQILPPRSDR